MLFLPIPPVPNNPADAPPVFRATTTCPLPHWWIFGAAIAGLVVGLYVAKGWK